MAWNGLKTVKQKPQSQNSIQTQLSEDFEILCFTIAPRLQTLKFLYLHSWLPVYPDQFYIATPKLFSTWSLVALKNSYRRYCNLRSIYLPMAVFWQNSLPEIYLSSQEKWELNLLKKRIRIYKTISRLVIRDFHSKKSFFQNMSVSINTELITQERLKNVH